MYSVSGVSLLRSWTGSALPESMRLNRNNGHIFIGVNNNFTGYSIYRYDMLGNNEHLLISGGGTVSPRWFGISLDESLAWVREDSGGGPDELYEWNLNTLVETNTGIDPPTSDVHPNHDTFMDTENGLFYEQDVTNGIIYTVPLTNPTWTSIIVPSGSTSFGFSLLRGRNKIVYADGIGDLYWADLITGANKTLIWDKSADPANIPTGNIKRVDDGYD